jgi:leucine-rich repeat protein SHOC2
MERAKLEQIIERARFDRYLTLSCCQITDLPESIGNLSNLIELRLGRNQLTSLPESIGNCTNLIYIDLWHNQLTSLPESIGSLTNLRKLILDFNQLKILPDSICNLNRLTNIYLRGSQLTNLPDNIGSLANLTELYLPEHQLTRLPDSIGNLIDLTSLDVGYNQLTSLPDSIGNLPNLISLNVSGNRLNSLPENIRNITNLISLYLDDNPLIDLSILKQLPNLERVGFMGVELEDRYWTKLSDWKSAWLLDEENAEIRRVIIEIVGYEKICDELNAITLDTWREYTLLEIDGLEEEIYDGGNEPIDSEPMILLKMTCPSTAHIHVLRVPPEMVSAEAAITWVNHGIHPDDFAIQT